MKHTLQEIEAFTRGLKNENNQGSHGELHIDRMEFKNIRSGESSFGFIAFNDDRQTYILTPVALPKNHIEILKGTLEYEDDVIEGMIENAREHEKGMWIDDFFYEWKYLEEAFEKD